MPERDARVAGVRPGLAAWLAVALLLLLGCSPASPSPTLTPTNPPTTLPMPTTPAVLPSGAVAAVCDRTVPGPAVAPAGAVTVDPAVDADLTAKTNAGPAGTTFWLAPGVHTLGRDQFGQVKPKDGDIYLGAPGAILDGRGLNRFAFIGEARDVTVAHLVVRGFVPPQDQGVVNHDSADGWTIRDNTIEKNKGAAVMGGARQQLLRNCLRDNGQYGINAYQPGNGIVGLVVEGNEITGNNTDDTEKVNPGCGCSGAAKFWAVNGADVRGNWVHDNRGVALWADTNDNDFLIEGNLIENNDGQALFYEISYNMIFRNNVVRNNGVASGQAFASKGDNFPEAAVYLSESGGEPRIKARTDKIEIAGNTFDNNWSGITAWENADRFCNSPANTSTGDCTELVDKVEKCVQPGIATPPLYDDCRWKTQNVDIHDNTFTATSPTSACSPGFSSRMAILSNYGTYPDWSPYKGEVIQKAITGDQNVRWHDNRYVGNWTFVLGDVGNAAELPAWQGAPVSQDGGSTFAPAPVAVTCPTTPSPTGTGGP